MTGTVADKDARLALVGSEHRAAVLAEVVRDTPHRPTARRLLRDWFNVCDALAPWADELRTEFERLGYVTDTHERLTLPCIVYRAAWPDDDAARALSWTTERDDAERFARILVGPRAWFLGIKRDDVDPHIFRGICTEAYGYLTSRDEHEVIAKTVREVEPIAVLARQPRPGATA